jgi:hypothetical protein
VLVDQMITEDHLSNVVRQIDLRKQAKTHISYIELKLREKNTELRTY